MKTVQIYLTFIFKATQNDNLNRQAQANLIVKVIDVNNHKPEILKSEYDINLQEHTPNGTIIGKIDAFDQDRVKKNYIVLYSPFYLLLYLFFKRKIMKLFMKLYMMKLITLLKLSKLTV